MDENDEIELNAAQLKKLGQKKLTREERKKRQRALDDIDVPDFLAFWKQKSLESGVEST